MDNRATSQENRATSQAAESADQQQIWTILFQRNLLDLIADSRLPLSVALGAARDMVDFLSPHEETCGDRHPARRSEKLWDIVFTDSREAMLYLYETAYHGMEIRFGPHATVRDVAVAIAEH